jgi:hypothetical protein
MLSSRLFAVLACAALAATARAQSVSIDTSADRSGSQATEIWAGFSNRSPKWGVLGNRPGMSFGIAAARVARRIKTTPGYALDWTVDFIPVAMSSPPIGYEEEGWVPSYSSLECKVSCRFPSGSAFGAGASPLGITATYRREHLFQPRLGMTGGVLMFDRAVPTIISTKFNFTATIEAGAQLLNRSGDGIIVMYRFHHLSNAGIGYDNSALASHVISVGGRWRSRGR